MQDEIQILLKILITGNAKAGKSSIVNQFSQSVFSETYLPTIGVQFEVKYQEILNFRVKYQIWDTAGQERFRSIVSTYYRGAVINIIVIDLTDPQALFTSSHWIDEARYHANISMQILLVGNKIDNLLQRRIQFEEAQEFAYQKDVYYIQTSALDGMNLN